MCKSSFFVFRINVVIKALKKQKRENLKSFYNV